MADDSVTINLRVLSPSSELEGGIHLQDLPAATTVRELRLKIQDAIASKPGPERMRLIYRGKVVANDADSLETVFGTENVGHAALSHHSSRKLTHAPSSASPKTRACTWSCESCRRPRPRPHRRRLRPSRAPRLPRPTPSAHRNLPQHRALPSRRTHSEPYHSLDRTRSHSQARRRTTTITTTHIPRMSTTTTMCSSRSTRWVLSAPCRSLRRCSSRLPRH